MSDKPLVLIWMQCLCYTWPIVFGEKIGRCGYCGEKPTTLVDEPASGRAEPIEGRY